MCRPHSLRPLSLSRSTQPGCRRAAQAEREVEQLVDRVAGLSRVEEIPAYGAQLIEEWIQRHSHAERRLFRA